jgi:hypothetical protein
VTREPCGDPCGQRVELVIGEPDRLRTHGPPGVLSASPVAALSAGRDNGPRCLRPARGRRGGRPGQLFVFTHTATGPERLEAPNY